MSAEAVVYALLSGAAPVTAIVDTKIYPAVAPEGTALPFLVYEEVSRIDRHAVSLADPAMVTTRMQITAVADHYAQLKTLLAAVHAACSNRRGLVAGIPDVCTRPAGRGPDLFDGERSVFSQSIDFMVTFNQDVP